MGKKHCNGFDERCGFQSAEGRSPEEERQLNKSANYFMHKRLERNPFPLKPSMSSTLKKTKIPQVIGKFIQPIAKKACALGVLHLGATNNWKSKEPSWFFIDRTYNMYEEETLRIVPCPNCFRRDNLMAIIFHLNDWHGMTNFKIGSWLEEKYHL